MRFIFWINERISFARPNLVSEPGENKIIEIITNQPDWSAPTIADLCKKRWDIELFFKAMKQNLQIKTFLGTCLLQLLDRLLSGLLSVCACVDSGDYSRRLDV